MTVTIRPATEEDLALLVENIRDIDRTEAEAVAGMPIEQAVAEAARRSIRTRAGYVDGRLVAVWGMGMRTVLSRDGMPWLLATKVLEEDRAARRAMVLHSRSELDALSEGFTKFWNMVHSHNRIAIRWLQWLGFEFGDGDIDVSGHPFRYFRKGF